MTVKAVENAKHVHEEDEEYFKSNVKYFKWSEEMNRIVTEGVRNHAKPKLILRNLKGSDVVSGRMPNRTELYYKIKAVKNMA